MPNMEPPRTKYLSQTAGRAVLYQPRGGSVRDITCLLVIFSLEEAVADHGSPMLGLRLPWLPGWLADQGKLQYSPTTAAHCGTVEKKLIILQRCSSPFSYLGCAWGSKGMFSTLLLMKTRACVRGITSTQHRRWWQSHGAAVFDQPYWRGFPFLLCIFHR